MEPTPDLTPELFWLAATATFTALLWLPYILKRIASLGLIRTMGNPSAVGPPLAPWEDRATRAHRNAVENLAVFAPLVLIAALIGVSTPTTVLATQAYFWARLGHYIVFVAGIPVARTLLFFVGFAAQMAFALAILSAA